MNSFPKPNDSSLKNILKTLREDSNEKKSFVTNRSSSSSSSTGTAALLKNNKTTSSDFASSNLYPILSEEEEEEKFQSFSLKKTILSSQFEMQRDQVYLNNNTNNYTFWSPHGWPIQCAACQSWLVIGSMRHITSIRPCLVESIETSFRSSCKSKTLAYTRSALKLLAIQHLRPSSSTFTRPKLTWIP